MGAYDRAPVPIGETCDSMHNIQLAFLHHSNMEGEQQRDCAPLAA
jgi:hypothetical protein